MNKLIAWIFMPTTEDRAFDWEAPPNYIRAAVGEVRWKPVGDTPMDNNFIFEPGWKRAEGLDQPLQERLELFDSFAWELAAIETDLACMISARGLGDPVREALMPLCERVQSRRQRMESLAKGEASDPTR